MAAMVAVAGVSFLRLAVAEALPIDGEAESRLTAERLAAYAEPGAPARYRELITRIKASPAELGAPAKNLRLPVRSWPDGRAQTVVFAKEAWISSDMQQVRGRGVRVEQFHEDGSPEAVLEAAEVMVDRKSLLAVAKGRVAGTFGTDHFSGIGALVDLDARYVQVLRRAKIVTQRMREANFAGRGLF